ncbi:MAG TPA: MarR family transcriptional regulator [Firmicutes bacterium]|nr:MarR family transcriptional regulator [Bacillota bacterium]
MNKNMVMLEALHRYYALWRESNAMYEEWAKTQGLSLNSILILYAFYDHGDCCTQKMISQKWTIPKQTVNTILKDFETKGYIELLPMHADKRNKIIHLTPKGKYFCDSIITQLHHMELYVMEKMGIERMTSLNDNLALFIDLFRKGETLGDV